MPEYLAPGVYVEEIDTGSKPIEGVSTSTAGVFGVTERGPVNAPILITGMGEFTRWFGERLNVLDYSDPNTGLHCYLPHAVEGFFTNGGKRMYLTRVLDLDLAARAATFLFDRGTDPGANTVLLRDMPENSGTVANLPLLLTLPDPELAVNDWIRIGDGSDAEYREVVQITAPDTVAVPLSLSLSRSHADPLAPIPVEQFTPATIGGGFTLVVPPPATRLAAGEDTVEITTATVVDLDNLINAAALPPPASPLLVAIAETGMANRLEHRFALQITRLSPTNARVRLDSPLRLSYANGSVVNHVDLLAAASTADLAPSARAGESLALVVNRGTDFELRTDVVVIQRADGQNREVRRIGELRRVTLTTPLTEEYPADTLVEGVDLGDDNHITMAAAAVGAGVPLTPITLTTPAEAAELSAGQTVILGTGVNRETAVVQSADPANGHIVILPPLAFAKIAGDPVIPVRSLTAPAAAGASFVAVNNRRGLAVGDVLRVGADEYVTVTRLPSRAPTGPDPGNILFAPPLTHSYPVAGTGVVRQNPPVVTNVQPSVLVIDAPEDGDTVLVSDGGGGTYAANTFLRFTTRTGEVFYHLVAATSPTLVPVMVTLSAALRRSHRAGSPVVERAAMMDIQALDAGAWGNRLRVSAEDEPAGLVTRTTLSVVISPTQIRLASGAGIEAGTILEFVDAAGNTVGPPVKVANINRATGQITLGAALTVAQQVVGLAVRSREFRLTVYLLRQPDPINPVRNETLLDSEVFRYLSMDPRHSRYVENVMGVTWNDVPGATQDDALRPLRRQDRRPEGESWYVRVRDLAQNIADPDDRQTALESIRLGPETLIDILPDGRQRPARQRLERVAGGDSLATLTDDLYAGADHITPENRTGLHTLRNVEEISIVACPGRTSVQIQNALINHCELMRYRFAVLDAHRPPHDSLPDIQNQRQQFDTKYAALYHPWLLIPDPYPTSLARIQEYPIPPSGHVLGVCSRTDIERGVHKAPANEVVRGIVGLQRVLNKEQHDILNPFPVNINLIRDFRPNNRGIRVFGGRVISSDSDWKYVNVRRLLIFIEASIDRGLQWVVFEPNEEPLWARVRRSITNFLTLVWRNGALEGTKPEEAFFVKCDRTTMTQTDLDSGRLICVIGVAPVKPAEFVIVRIGLWTAHAEE